MNYFLIFLFFNILTIFLMKLVAYLYGRTEFASMNGRFFYSSPILCPKTYAKIPRQAPRTLSRTAKAQITYELIFSCLALIIIHNYFQILINEFSFLAAYKSYFLIFYVYIFTLFLSASLKAVSYLFRSSAEPMHHKPYLAKNINEFWTKRWNIWVRNWLHYLGKKIFPENIKYRQLSIFFISGLFHESMVNLPYYIYTGEILFGSMMGYFFIQYIALRIDKTILSKQLPQARYAFMWLAIILPAPLFVNKAFLLFFGFN